VAHVSPLGKTCHYLTMVEPRGFEPSRVTDDSETTCAVPARTPGAKSGALAADSAPQDRSEARGDGPPDADLQAVIAAWPNLPQAVRVNILAMIRATQRSPVNGPDGTTGPRTRDSSGKDKGVADLVRTCAPDLSDTFALLRKLANLPPEAREALAGLFAADPD